MAENAVTLKEGFEKLCLFSQISESNKSFLAYKKDALADIMDFLKDCAFESDQDNIDFINAFAEYAKTFAISNYSRIDLCGIRNTGSVSQSSKYLIRYLNAGAPLIGSNEWAQLLDFGIEQTFFAPPNLTEVLWAILHPNEALVVQFNVDMARQFQGVIYPDDPNIKWCGIGDAFLHTYWNALNCAGIGEQLAIEVGDNHENKRFPVLHLEWEMDLFNNSVGRAIGLAHEDDGDLLTFQTFVLTAIANGECIYLTPINHVLSPPFDPICTTCLNGILPNTVSLPTNQ
jgi:hypothetical protein